MKKFIASFLIITLFGEAVNPVPRITRISGTAKRGCHVSAPFHNKIRVIRGLVRGWLP